MCSVFTILFLDHVLLPKIILDIQQWKRVIWRVHCISLVKQEEAQLNVASGTIERSSADVYIGDKVTKTNCKLLVDLKVYIWAYWVS